MIDEGVREEVVRLKEKGESIATIARQLGISRGSVYGILNGDGSGNDQPRERGRHRHRPFITKKKEIILDRPSQRVQDRRDDTEIVTLEVERQKGLKELKNVIGSQVSPEVQKKKDEIEIKNLDLEGFEADRKLTAREEEERAKVRIEEEARIREKMKQEALEDEKARLADRRWWVQGWQDWALSQKIPWGVSLLAEWKFKVKDAVGEVLKNRSEDEPKWDIEQLVKNTINVTIQPYLDEQKAKRKVQLIQSWAFPQIDTYIKGQGLEGYLNEEGKGKIREDVKNHFMKVLTGTESFIFSFQVTDLLNIFLKEVKEKVRGAREEKERERQEREKRGGEEKEAEEKAFWEKVREKREKERVEELLQTGMGQFNLYLLRNRKELGIVNTQEQERAKRHLEKELREEIEGDETNQEVEEIADEILTDFFFEE